MLVTASTVKDSVANLRFFVAANLASGVDHMIVFLDAPKADGQAEAAAFLEDHPHVTCVKAGRTWWGETPAGNLNNRQRMNANWAKELMSGLGWAEWLFHIDGDEVAHVDRGALASLPHRTDAVRLTTFEAVARVGAPDRAPLFKTLLEPADLNLLQVLGAIDEPTNQAYFHGHLMGKSGIRVDSPLSLTVHDAVQPDGRRAPGEIHEGLTVLHYDAPTEDEFVRKWTALATAGPARYRQDRQATARALRTLIGRELADEVRAKYLRQIYATYIADDVDLLSELNFLTELDPLAGAHSPTSLDAEQKAALDEKVRAMRDQPKERYLVRDRNKDGSADETATESVSDRVRNRWNRRGGPERL